MIGRIFDLAFDVIAIVLWAFCGSERGAHCGESLAEDEARWRTYRAAQEDRWFT